MNSKNRLMVLMTVMVSIPVLICLHKYSHKNTCNTPLSTCMDIEAIDPSQEESSEQSVENLPQEIPVAQETKNEPTGTTTIDTVSQEEEEIMPEADADDTNKRKQVIALVQEGISYVEKNPFDQAMNAFTHSRDFIRGELYLFVYDTKGFQYASGLDERLVWKDWFNLRDMFGTFMVQEMIKKAKAGGGWVTYQWRNATKVTYVKLFNKDGNEYVIGAGYYPHSKRDIVIGLVKAAVSYFNDIVIRKGFLVDEVFSTLSFPAGRFVMGDLYLYAVRFDGQMLANGDRPGLIGTNVLSVTDSQGKLVNQEIINRLKKTDEGIWIQYKSKNATKLAYAQKVTDKEGKSYFIACGYYPNAVPEKAVELVKNGYEFMKQHGMTAGVNEFSSRQVDTYRYGDLYLVVWDMKGTIIAHGANLDSIGINQYNLKDEDGKFYVQEIINKANHGGGWVDFKLKNAFQSIYVEKVEMGTDDFVIGSGLYPISKREMALLLARSAAGYLRSHSEEQAFAAFSDPNGKFIRGDLYVFVIGFDGIAKVWGDSHELIWRNILDAKDDNGKPYIQIFINTVKQGPAQVAYRINGQDRIALLEMVEKNGQNYVVGTQYFL